MTLTTDEEPLIDDQVSPDGEAPREGSLNTTAMRRVLASGFLGNMIETYDFVLYANAAPPSSGTTVTGSAGRRHSWPP